MSNAFELIKENAYSLMQRAPFDSFAAGVIDFNTGSTQFFEIYQKNMNEGRPHLCFDLASLTKPLSLASIYHKTPELFDNDMKLLLSHQGGLPAWSILRRDNWNEVISSYPIKKTNVLYSDLSALRLMLEIEKKTATSLDKLVKYYWEDGLYHWRNLPAVHRFPVTGMRAGKQIQGEVHDPNAFNLKRYCSHAGLFATIEGAGKSLLSMQVKTNFLDQIKQEFKTFNSKQRFIIGWDTPSGENPLCGPGFGPHTFGHLGFTGTSLWIDAHKKQGIIILTNATQYGWYDKNYLNSMRRRLGEIFWKTI